MASKATAEKWLKDLTELAATNGWQQLDGIKSVIQSQAISFVRESLGVRESVTLLTYYNWSTGQVQRSAFTTTRNGNRDITLRDVPRLLTFK